MTPPKLRADIEAAATWVEDVVFAADEPDDNTRTALAHDMIEQASAQWKVSKESIIHELDARHAERFLRSVPSIPYRKRK